MDNDQEHYIEFLEAREDATEFLDPAEQPFDLIAPAMCMSCPGDV